MKPTSGLRWVPKAAVYMRWILQCVGLWQWPRVQLECRQAFLGLNTTGNRMACRLALKDFCHSAVAVNLICTCFVLLSFWRLRTWEYHACIKLILTWYRKMQEPLFNLDTSKRSSLKHLEPSFHLGYADRDCGRSTRDQGTWIVTIQTHGPASLGQKTVWVVILGTRKLKLCQDFGIDPLRSLQYMLHWHATRSDGAQHLFASPDLDILPFCKEMVKWERGQRLFKRDSWPSFCQVCQVCHDFLENSWKSRKAAR